MHRKCYTLFVLIMVLSQVVLHGEVFNEVVICVLQAWPLEPMASAAQPWGRVLEWSKTRRCEGQTKEVKAKHLHTKLKKKNLSKPWTSLKRMITRPRQWKDDQGVCARREGGCRVMKCVASIQDLCNKERSQQMKQEASHYGFKASRRKDAALTWNGSWSIQTWSTSYHLDLTYLARQEWSCVDLIWTWGRSEKSRKHVWI